MQRRRPGRDDSSRTRSTNSMTVGRGETNLRVEIEEGAGLNVEVDAIRLEPTPELVKQARLPESTEPPILRQLSFLLQVEAESQDFNVIIRGGATGGRYRMVVSSLA